MLAILSDLHFCDGTATPKNVDPRAFVIALGDIYDDARAIYEANKAAGKPDPTCHLDIVLLGDVFDLLRTTRWFEEKIGAETVEVTAAGRPWWSKEALSGKRPPDEVMARAHRILDAAIEANQGALATLRGSSDDERVKLPREGVRVRRIMLAGNHDRLALHDEALYGKMRVALGAEDERTLAAEGIYPHRLEMPAYSLLARHGHEWDLFNFESFRAEPKGADYDDEQYLPAPVGDPITTDLVARLPFEMRKNLDRLDVSGRFSQDEKDEIHRRLQRIDDVRPMLASLQWVYQEVARIHASLADVEKKAVLSGALDATVHKIVADFEALDYFQAWYDKHSHWYHPFDEVAVLKKALALLSTVSLAAVDRLADVVDPLLSRAADRDDNRAGASTENERAHLARMEAKGLRFIVYGHTHDAEQVALAADPLIQDVYLNSGTFRQRVFLTDDHKGFLASDYMSYLSFFTEEEAATWRDPLPIPIRGPAYNAWTGLRNR